MFYLCIYVGFIKELVLLSLYVNKLNWIIIMKVKEGHKVSSGPIRIPVQPRTSCARILCVSREYKHSKSSCIVLSSFRCVVPVPNICAVHEILVSDLPGWGFCGVLNLSAHVKKIFLIVMYIGIVWRANTKFCERSCSISVY